MLLTLERTRQFRGLLIHSEERFEKYQLQRLPYGNYRGLIDSFPEGLTPGTCKWCLRPTDTRRKSWHEYCVPAYFVATGSPLQTLPEWSSGYCVICGERGRDLDHNLAIGIAWLRQDKRSIIRAYTLDNIRWMCREHHKIKTKNDMLIMDNLKKGKDESSPQHMRRVAREQLPLL